MKRKTDNDSNAAAMNALADLFERDAAEIAADPRYTQPDGKTLPLVAELQTHARDLRRQADTRRNGKPKRNRRAR